MGIAYMIVFSFAWLGKQGVWESKDGFSRFPNYRSF